ncbi:ADP-ribosylation factor-like protein 2 [Metarhizium anisopliae]
MLSILRKARLKDKEMRILMLGLDNAGKTTIVKKIMGEDVNTALLSRRLTTMGDVGGQKTLRSYWRNYFEKTDALIWVVDATDRLRIDDCRDELHGLLLEEVSRIRWHGTESFLLTTRQRLSGASLLILANKTDVEGCMDEQEIRKALRLDEIRTHQWNILRCSAMTGENLQEGLAWVVADAKKRLFLY